MDAATNIEAPQPVAVPVAATEPPRTVGIIRWALNPGKKSLHLVGFGPGFALQQAVCGARSKHGSWRAAVQPIRKRSVCHACERWLAAQKAEAK